MSKTKVVFFDAGGTLFRPYPSVGGVYAKVAAQHGVHVDAEHVEKIFHEKWHERNGLASLQGLSSEKIERDWWYRMVRDVFGGYSSSPAAAGRGSMDSPPTTAGNDGILFRDFEAFFQELYDLFARAECWRLFDDTVPVLDALKKKGIRLAIISNWDHRLFSIVKQLDLSDYFEQVTASSVVGTAKPGKRIFEAALQGMGVLAADSLHVGDSLEDDYHGATRMGIKAVLLDRKKKAYNGVVRIDSLSQLPDLL